MKTLAQFKIEEKVAQIDLLKGQGRMFAKVNDKNLVVASNCDMKKPLFVSNNDEKGILVLHNSVATVAQTI